MAANGRDSLTLRDLPKILTSELFNEHTLPANSPFITFLSTIKDAKYKFIQSVKFKIYARLFAEFFWQIIINTQLRETLGPRLFIDLLYIRRNNGLCCNIWEFELRCAIVFYSQHYITEKLRHSKMPSSTHKPILDYLRLINDAFLIRESLIAPYLLVENLQNFFEYSRMRPAVAVSLNILPESNHNQ